MEQLLNQLSLWMGLAGGFITQLLGGWDAMLIVLIITVGLDYLVGVLCFVYQRKPCGDIGLKGIIKKLVIFIIVAVTSAIQAAVQQDIPLREMVIVFFAANECISILKKAVRMGIRIPERLKQLLLKLRDGEIDKTDKSEKEDFNGKAGN